MASARARTIRCSLELPHDEQLFVISAMIRIGLCLPKSPRNSAGCIPLVRPHPEHWAAMLSFASIALAKGVAHAE